MSNPKGPKDLDAGLRRLTLEANFESFAADIEIPAGGDVTIPNRFRGGKVPRLWLVVDNRGNGFIKRGSSEWNATSLYFSNTSATEDTDVTVLFLK